MIRYISWPKSFRGILSRKNVSALIKNICKDHNVIINEHSIIVCDDPMIINQNLAFLNHDYPTDNICINFSDDSFVLESESYLGIDEIRRNAIAYNVSFEEEFLRVVIHSTLHLCGYKDGKKSEKKLMTLKENEYLIKCFTWNEKR